MSDPSSWKFVHVTDIHIGSPRSYRFKPAINENWATAAGQIKAIAPDLLLVGGDVTRDGTHHVYELKGSKAELDRLGIPWHAIPGNMDTGNKHTDRQGALSDRDDVACNVTEDQLERFRRHVQPFPWSFVHRGVRFSGCYEVVANTDLPSAEAQAMWLRRLAAEPRTQWHVMLNHYPLFTESIDQGPADLTTPDGYLQWYFSLDPEPRRRVLDAYHAAGVTHVLSGHVHCRRPPMVIDGITFCFGASTATVQWADHWADGDPRQGFQVFTVTPEGIGYRFEPLTRVSTRTDGWGPGGHPKPEARVYPPGCSPA